MAFHQRCQRVLPCLIRALCIGGFLLQSALLTVSQAQMTLDGSMGTRGPLAGPNYTIGAELGQIRGNNLFHSFGAFNIRTGESATFTGPTTIHNVLSRVTGGNLSIIDGLLRSQIPGANLFLFNPSGVIFGPNASLDVSGSFHVSTADYLRLADGAIFAAQPFLPSVLSVAPPEAFGFLTPMPAPIAILGSALQVPDGQALSVVGGDIAVQSFLSQTPTLTARGGQINLASVASVGEVGLSPSLHTNTLAQLGTLDVREARLSTNGNAGGTVRIRGGRLMLDNAVVVATTQGDVHGAAVGVDIEARQEAVITNGTGIATATLGAGRAGDIRLAAGRVEFGQGAFILSRTFPGSTGDAGHVAIAAGDMQMQDGATIVTIGAGAGRSGNLTLEVGQ